MTTGPHPQPTGWTAALTVLALLAAASGWFFVSWRVMHTAAGDAVGEAFGVAFGLLIVVSVVGVIRARRADER